MYINDLYPKMKFVLSGSESLLLRKGAGEMMTGRFYHFILPHLSFREFIALKGKSLPLSSAELNALFREFVERGGFPELINERDLEDVGQYVRLFVLDKILFKDIPRIAGIRDTELLLSLVEMVAQNPGEYIEYSSLAQQMGRDRRVIKAYMEWLGQAFLVRLLANYRKGRLPSLRKLKRAYLTDNGIANAFSIPRTQESFSRKVEAAVVNALNAEAFWRNRHEVDAVVGGKPIEVKYKDGISSRDFDGLREFMRKFGVREGVLVTMRDRKRMRFREGTILCIPAPSLLLNPQAIRGVISS